MTFIYTDHVKDLDSSVLDGIYYNEDTAELAVELKNGVIAGYDDVPEDVARAFLKHESLGGSAGSYWNTMIKPNYPGFDTSWIEKFVSEVEDEPSEPEDELIAMAPVAEDEESNFNVENFVSQLPGSVTLEEALRKLREQLAGEVKEETPIDLTNRSEFVVFFRYEALNGDIRIDDVTLFAGNEAGALESFQAFAKVAGYDKVQVTSVTRFFD